MAPKRLALAGDKQLVVEPSIKARKRATYDTRMLNNVEKGKRYLELFSHWCVIPSRRIDFGELSYFGFDRLFVTMRWLPLVSLNEVFYTWLVKCFYSNMTLEE